MKKNASPKSIVQRYVLIGAVFGIYFGWTFRPSIYPSIWTIIGLSSLVTIVMVLLRLWRGERGGLLAFAAGTFLRYALLVSVIALRYPVYNWGGRTAVTIMTVVFGALAGYWLAIREQDG